MKIKKHKSAAHSRRCPVYPNQAAPDYYWQKAINISAGIASGIGLAASVIFFTVLM